MALMNTSFLQTLITNTQAELTAYMAASLAFANNGALQSYTLDTGQSRQVVTRSDLPWIQDAIDGLMNRCATLEARLNGSGTTHVRPAW